MNIAHLLPNSVIYPLPAHNGRYDWVLQLATLQRQAGHTVTIYSNKQSRFDNGIQSQGIKTVGYDKKDNNIALLKLALENNHNIYHSHYDELHYEVAHLTKKPIVATQHWWPSENTIRLAAETLPHTVWAVPPTKYMYDFDRAHNIQTNNFIHHGIDLSFYTKTISRKSDRLLFVGRISPEKNLELAIAAAIASDSPLDIVGKITSKNIDYWNTLKDDIDGQQIRYLGSKNREEVRDLYSTARAVIFPSGANEAFGLVGIESQACGTPVIAKRGGSRSELMIDEKTGYLCDSLQDFTTAIKHIDLIKSENCIVFAQQFDVRKMADNYTELYKILI
ncbi:MAG: glycosyltransferase [Chloroflexi bacterium]|nr:MAG: glycosyltransferase [Chloroflexota bacterium]